MLRPRNDLRLTIKAVTHDVAELLLSVQHASALPQHAVDALGESCQAFVGKMVLDEILQIEVDGEMLCGAAAARIFGPVDEAAEPHSRLAMLSRRALQYAETLGIESAARLAEKLYCYNRVPASRWWRRLLPDGAAVANYLGIYNRLPAALLDADWLGPSVDDAGTWIAWQSKRVAPPAGPVYKLYVSPVCSAIPEVLAATIESGTRFDAFYWKVGGNLYGLLRPDKLIFYFEHLADLQAAASEIIRNVNGCPAQGVPFTAALEPGGLVSWGIDPPQERSSVIWLKSESWRERICSRLATALIIAKRGDGVSPVGFALRRLQLEGIDINTWAPAQ